MHFELFLAQQDVQKAKLAKCISTALHYTHHCCTESYLFGCDTGLAGLSFGCGRAYMLLCMRACSERL